MGQTLTQGNDRFVGGAINDDDVYGLDGDDSILYTSASSPSFPDADAYGGGGRDFIGINNNANGQLDGRGGSGEDTIYGAQSADYLYGGQSNDLLIGGNWSRNSDGTVRQSNLSTSTGNDYLYGGTQRDSLWGLDGDDYLFGGSGNDGGGPFSFRSSTFQNIFNQFELGLFGGDGDDYIDGGLGDDTMYGGNGADTIIANAGTDRVFAGAGADLVIGGYLADAVAIVNGNGGNDYLIGNVGNDALSGDEDNDLIFGKGGWDYLTGGTGNDQIYGGGGSDYMVGGTGSDAFSMFDDINGGDFDYIADFQYGVDYIVLPEYARYGIYTYQSGADAVAIAASAGTYWYLTVANTTLAELDASIAYY